jgi:predicted amidohydrolase/ribosomal protein S18 acetylase RimI-like enzyme
LGGAAHGAHDFVEINPRRRERAPNQRYAEKMPSYDEIDLTPFERRLVLRRLQSEDYESVVALQKRCFPQMKPWLREQFDSQLRIFPEGQICIELDGRIVASAASLIVDSAEYSEWADWMKISGSGFIKNHDESGDTLYGIEIQVDPEYRGMRLARRLYSERKNLCRARNIASMMIGGRIPGYAKLAAEMTPQEYVRAVIDKKLYDPVLTTQLANGFVLKEIVPDYLPSDEDSAGFATCLEWPNLDYVPKRHHRHRRAVANVRLGLVQYQMRAIESWEEFARQCRFFVDVAADYQTDIVVFPELFTVQLLSLVKAVDPATSARRLADLTPEFIRLFGELSVKYAVNIVAGSQFTVEAGNLYNVSFLFRRDGSIGRQYKIHVTPNERRWWGLCGGDRMEVFDTDRGKVAILICYDVEFPELARFAVSRGAQILLVPFNTSDREGYLRVRACAQARCIENHAYAALAGCVGNLPFVENADIHYAQSVILSPSDVGFSRDGIGVEASANIETVVVHDVDTERLRRHRAAGTVQNWNDRRTDLYRVLWKGEGEPHEI